MEELKTFNGLTIIRTDENDGGFIVGLVEPNGEVFALITFNEDWDEWEWESSHSAHLTYLIGVVDHEFAKHDKARNQKNNALEPHWQRVVEEYGGKTTD